MHKYKVVGTTSQTNVNHQPSTINHYSPPTSERSASFDHLKGMIVRLEAGNTALTKVVTNKDTMQECLTKMADMTALRHKGNQILVETCTTLNSRHVADAGTIAMLQERIKTFDHDLAQEREKNDALQTTLNETIAALSAEKKSHDQYRDKSHDAITSMLVDKVGCANSTYFYHRRKLNQEKICFYTTSVLFFNIF